MNTENWNCVTIDHSEEEKYRYYDEIISMVISELYQHSEEEGVIRLYRFNRKNLEHMCILQIALIARDLFHFPIEVDASWRDVFNLNWQLRKNYDKVKRYKLKMNKNDGKGVNTLMLIDKYHSIIKTGPELFNFIDIYKAYYEGSK